MILSYYHFAGEPVEHPNAVAQDVQPRRPDPGGRRDLPR